MRIERFENVTLYEGDCLEILPTLDAGSVDAVVTDPPYGTTDCKWDSVIPLAPMWNELNRLVKPNAAIVLMATQPFTSILVTSKLPWFKYRWVWEKSRPGGFVSAKLRPLKDNEEACVFSKGTIANCSTNNMPYFPQDVRPGKAWKRPTKYTGSDGVNYVRPSHQTERTLDGEGYPREIIRFSNHNGIVLHPTQKPVALMEYMIRTYTQEGETVLDFCCGSGTTGVACVNTGRKAILIEREPKYFDIACKRIESALNEQPLLAGADR